MGLPIVPKANNHYIMDWFVDENLGLIKYKSTFLIAGFFHIPMHKVILAWPINKVSN